MRMLRPSKHDHPDRTVIGVSLVILKKMEADSVVGYDALLDYVEKRVDGGRFLLLPALDLLFVLGVLEYYPQNDIFELVSTR